jgi:geranylgeranylglycerol-phosphate geranylgeranyltransferase
MEYTHFRGNVSKDGEKRTTVVDGSEDTTYNNRIIKTEAKTIFKRLQAINMVSNSTITQYLRAFVYYTKARSNVYIFPFATLISLILGFHGNDVNYGVAICAVSASYFMAFAAYVYNDIADFKLDKINKTNRPSVTGEATKRQLIIIVFIINGIALLLTSAISLDALYVSVLFIILGIAYSHPSLNLKDKFPLKTVVTAAGAGLLSLLGGIAAQTYDDNDSFSSSSLVPMIYAGSFFFAFFFILGPLGDIADLNGDRIVGRRTFPIVLGIRSTIMVMLTIPVIIMLMSFLLGYFSHQDDVYSIGSNNKYSFNFINLSGTYLIFGACITTLVFILRISKKVDDVLSIKAMRPKMRFLHILLQISLLVTFL